MNTLTLIKSKSRKQAALHDAQISHTAYRGVEYDQRNVESKELTAHSAIVVVHTASEVCMLKVSLEYDLPEYDPMKHDPDKTFAFLTYRESITQNG